MKRRKEEITTIALYFFLPLLPFDFPARSSLLQLLLLSQGGDGSSSLLLSQGRVK